MADDQGTHDASMDELAEEAKFLSAMHAFRAARRSGDSDAEREAEQAWREQVRAELIAKMRGEA